MLGTPLFMATEQATGDGRAVDGRDDLYALGAVAYFLLTGRPPFEGGDRLAVLIAHARDPVVPPSRVRADIPGDLERVVLRCLAKGPDERFPDAEGLERALGACAARGIGTASVPPGGGGTPTCVRRAIRDRASLRWHSVIRSRMPKSLARDPLRPISPTPATGARHFAVEEGTAGTGNDPSSHC